VEEGVGVLDVFVFKVSRNILAHGVAVTIMLCVYMHERTAHFTNAVLSIYRCMHCAVLACGWRARMRQT